MFIFLFLITIMTSSLMAMDEIVITIEDAYRMQQEHKQSTERFVQQKDTLYQQAGSNIEKGLYGFLATCVWWSKVMCLNHCAAPTMSDAYILGATSSFCCTFCAAGCKDCCKAWMLKEK